MKLAVFSDLHLDAPFAWLSTNGEVARRRRRALRDTLERVVEVAREARADALLCGGDLYEQERFTPDTAAFLRESFAALQPMPVFLAPGNHDWYGPRSLYRQVAWSPNVRVFSEDRLAAVTLAEGLTLWGAAHRAPANTAGFLDGFQVDRGGVHLALFHGSERGWFQDQESDKTLHAPFDAEQIERAGLHHAFVGHYHRPRDATRHTYPGNPDPLTFGEDGRRGVVIATVKPDGSVERERRVVAVSQVHDRALDLTGCGSQQEVRERLVELVRDLRGAVRVTLQGELAPTMELRPAELSDAAPWLEGLVVRVGGLRTGYDLAAIQQEQTVRGQFVRDVLAASQLSDDERRRVLLTGLRALAGRDDLEVP